MEKEEEEEEEEEEEAKEEEDGESGPNDPFRRETNGRTNNVLRKERGEGGSPVPFLSGFLGGLGGLFFVGRKAVIGCTTSRLASLSPLPFRLACLSWSSPSPVLPL
jgi:hypothetical protein